MQPAGTKYVDPCPIKAMTLTSNVIRITNESIEYYDSCLLVPHEALRVLTERTLRVLPFYDPEQHPWKAERMRIWIEDVYIPIVHEHHDAEEKLFFPFYRKLGVGNFDEQVADHVILMKNLEEVRNAVASKSGDLLREKFHALAEHMTKHLDDEERFWPAELKKYPQSEMKKVEKQIVSQGSKSGVPFQMMLILICEAMGVNLLGEHPDNGWAPPALKNSFRANLPYVVRRLLVPGWTKKWKRYQAVLLSMLDEDEHVFLAEQEPPRCIVCRRITSTGKN